MRLTLLFVAAVAVAACGGGSDSQAGSPAASVATDDRAAESEPTAVTNDRGGLRAAFSAEFDHVTRERSCPVTAIHFTDESTGEPEEWEWTFGDGTTSTDQNPTWEPGEAPFVVTLKVSDGDSSDSITERIHTYVC